uniref:RAB6-interacting golgin n=1 Tax=Quercus lobata TaxID=97700 RepID=A0A7N2LHV0_QUELO
MQKMKNIGSSGRLSTEESEDEDISRLAISTFQAKEEEIERRKMAVKEKVELQLGRAEEESRRLAQIWDEKEYKEALEAFQEKNKEKTQLIATLMELLTESEKLQNSRC